MGIERAIREATRGDAEAIAAMYQGTWPIHWHTPEIVRFQFGILEPIGGTVLVALEGERVVGHCEFVPTREPEPYGFWGYLEALEVHREFYRQGIGTTLVNEAIRRCQALGCTRFGSGPDDERAEGLYRKCGMRRVERGVATHFAIEGEAPKPRVEALEELSPEDRPWEEWLHILGRSHCAPYWWSMAFRRSEAGEEGYEGAFAVRLRGETGTAMAFNCGSWLHVLLPPGRAAGHDLLQNAVAYGVHRLKSQGKESFHTLMPVDLADAVRAVPGIYPSESHFHFHMWMPLGRRR